MPRLPVKRERTTNTRSTSSSSTARHTRSGRSRTASTVSPASAPSLTVDAQQVNMNEHTGNEALHTLGTGATHLNQGITKLEQLNIGATLTSLPKYAMVGDQSAGKSSIVQALCGIPLPRGDGTTTRCPFHITTSSQTPSSGSWACNVSVKQQHEYEPIAGKWSPNEKANVTVFGTVNTQEDLERTLHRAQTALLNPQHDPRKYVPLETNNKTPKQVHFSPNLVCLDYQAPDIPELAFYDLPGCINNFDMSQPGGGTWEKSQELEENLVNMINSTVVDYIKDEQCLVLVACSADQDVENSLTMKHIRRSGAEERCIGVFTKADLVPNSKVTEIQKVLRGEKYPLGKDGKKWFITRQSSQQDVSRGLDFGTATKLEDDMFVKRPWTGQRDLRGQYGTKLLRREIAGSLTRHIQSELPKMADVVRSRLNEVHTELEEFPEPPDEPNQVVVELIQQVCSRLSEHIDFGTNDNFFRMEFDAHMDWFSQQLLASRLEITVGKSSISTSAIVVDNINAEHVSGSGKVNGTSTLKRKRLPEKKPSVPVKIVADDGAPVIKLTLGLEDLSGRYERGATNSIPGSINDKVTLEQVRESCSNWKPIVDNVLQGVSALGFRIIKESMQERLRGWEHSKLYKTMMQAQPSITKRNYEHEKNVHLERLILQRCPLKSSSNTQGSSSQWITERTASDEHGPTIGCVARIYTYHDLMSDNLASVAGTLLRSSVLEEFKDEAAKVVRTELKVCDAHYCAALLAAKPEREEERNALVDEKAQLEEAFVIIENMQDEE